MRHRVVIEFSGERAERRTDLRRAGDARLQRLVIRAPEGQLLGGAARTSCGAGDAQRDLGDDLALEGRARAGKYYDTHAGAAGGCPLIRALTRAVGRAPVPCSGTVLRVAYGRIAVRRGCERRHTRASLDRHETDLPVRACAGQRGRVEDSEVVERKPWRCPRPCRHWRRALALPFLSGKCGKRNRCRPPHHAATRRCRGWIHTSGYALPASADCCRWHRPKRKMTTRLHTILRTQYDSSCHCRWVAGTATDRDSIE